MEDSIISVKGLQKTYKVHQREKGGLASAVKGLIHRKYKIVDALKGIDLEIKAGEVRGLIGPNGAGKSTLIKIISGILYPTAGSVRVMEYIPWLQREEYVRNIGVLFGQKTQLWWDLPAIDMFLLNKKMYNISDVVYERNMEYFTDLLKIGEIMTKPVRVLSLGERMRCEFVYALLHEPKLVYLDEPTIGLDILSKDAIRRFIKEVNQEKNTTFIVTTHDLNDIEELCDRITIMNGGIKVYDDTIDNLKAYFENRKCITVKLSKPVDSGMLQDLCVVAEKPLSLELEVDLNERPLKDVIYSVFDRLPVVDINISGIHIEKIIKQIYAG